MGFGKTLVLDAAFDTEERRQFARRLTTGLFLQDERLRGIAVPANPGVWEHNQQDGSCHLLPERGVILVITDEQDCETVFGFYQYPGSVKDIHGRTLAETNLTGGWYFSDFVDRPDPRFRKLVRLFAEKGFLRDQKDEFNVSP